MNGYQITFFTYQDRRHRGMLISDWLVHQSQELGLRGVTVIPASESMGQHHHIHAAHFFELSDQPVTVQFAVTPEEADRLFACLRTEQIKLFYVKTPVEFGVTGEE